MDDDVPSTVSSVPDAGSRASLLVCVGENPAAIATVGEGHWLAERLRARWMALYVRTPRHDRLDEETKDRISAALARAEQLGAEIMALPAESGIAREIVGFAREHDITHIVLGRSRRGWWRRLVAEPVAANVVRHAEGLGVILVAHPPKDAAAPEHLPAPKRPRQAWWHDFAWANVGVAVAAVVAAALESKFSGPHLSLIFLTAVLLVAARLGVWPALYASGLSFLGFAFFFAPPYYSLLAVNPQDVFTLALFLLVATLTGNLAGRLKRQVDSMRAAARTTTNLYELSRKVAAAGALDDVIRAAVEHVASALECQSLILLPRHEKLEVAGAFPAKCDLDESDRTAAERVWTETEPTRSDDGAFTVNTWQFQPLRTRSGVVGVLGLRMEGRSAPVTDRRRLVDAMANQLAVAIERTLLTREMEDARVLNEAEHLRAALLSSVSHDLKTPLVSIIGAATALTDDNVKLPVNARRSLLQAILDEAQRLHRFVQNLLDMTRLSYGGLQITPRWCELGEIVNRARRETEKILSKNRLDVRLPDDLPELRVDPVLIEHVLVNLLDNAAKYAPPGTRVEVAARTAENSIAVTVTDEGPGIPDEEREAVFDQFYRIRAEDRQAAGTGLGLSICRGLINAHGGRIAITAGPGQTGTCVTVTLPLETGAPNAPQQVEPATEESEP